MYNIYYIHTALFIELPNETETSKFDNGAKVTSGGVYCRAAAVDDESNVPQSKKGESQVPAG